MKTSAKEQWLANTLRQAMPLSLFFGLSLCFLPPLSFANEDEVKREKPVEPAEKDDHDKTATSPKPSVPDYKYAVDFFSAFLAARGDFIGSSMHLMAQIYSDQEDERDARRASELEQIEAQAVDQAPESIMDSLDDRPLDVLGYATSGNGPNLDAPPESVMDSLDDRPLDVLGYATTAVGDAPAESILDEVSTPSFSSMFNSGAAPTPTPEQQAQIDKALKNAAESPGLNQALQDFGTPEVKSALSTPKAAPAITP